MFGLAQHGILLDQQPWFPLSDTGNRCSRPEAAESCPDAENGYIFIGRDRDK